MFIMLLKFIFLGFVQGFMEAIPVSSSGHLLIVEHIVDLGLNPNQLETLALITNLGSLIAVIVLFWKDIVNLIHDFFAYFKTGDKKYQANTKYCFWIVIATIPAGIMGLVVTKLGFFDFLESNIKFIGLMLLVTALFLFIIKDFKGYKKVENMKFKDALIIGLFQVVALIPGISRSGSTIVGSMFQGLDRETSFNFSFLLFIPISIATSLLGLKDLFTMNEAAIVYFYYFMAFLTSLIVTYFSMKLFKKIMVNGKLIYFVWYCLIVGLTVVLFLK